MKYSPPRYLLRRFELLRAVNPGQNFLEVGAGKLELAQDLLQFFQTGTLVELNEGAEEIFNGLPPLIQDKLDLHIMDFLSLSIASTYDCVVSCEVLEHVERENEFLQKISKYLRPGGQLILSVPSKMKYWSKDDEMVGHVRRYEKDSARRLLVEHGFENIRIISYGFPFTHISRWLRILVYTVFAQKELKSKSIIERTTWSGIQQFQLVPKWAKLVSNQYTIYPFALIASIFNQFDWSDGYLIFANKPK